MTPLGGWFNGGGFAGVALSAIEANVRAVRPAPVGHCVNNWSESAPIISQTILNAWRDFGEERSGNEATIFQLAQACDQHLWADTPERLLQLTETPRSLEKVAKDLDGPFAANYLERAFDRTGSAGRAGNHRGILRCS